MVVTGRLSNAWEGYNYKSVHSVLILGEVAFKAFPHPPKTLGGTIGSPGGEMAPS